ncbi:MAG: hypothetical protein DRQ43_09675, partial [Gammaproteobacteria bacterium]
IIKQMMQRCRKHRNVSGVWGNTMSVVVPQLKIHQHGLHPNQAELDYDFYGKQFPKVLTTRIMTFTENNFLKS